MTTTRALDLYQEYRPDYACPRRPILLKVAPAQYLSLTGLGEPGGENFDRKLAALYQVAFIVKMAHQQAGYDFKIARPEAFWLGPEGEPTATWNWRLATRVPDFVAPSDVAHARDALSAFGHEFVSDVTLIRYEEEWCVQMLRTGSYETEAQSLKEMRAYIEANGWRFSGPTHEIYLSDPRRVEADRLRTILRHPVKASFERLLAGAS